MKHARLVLLVSLLGCSTGAGLGEAPRGPASASSPPAVQVAPAREDDTHVMGVLQMRDERVTLMAARDGVRVTVRDGAGAIVARDVPVDELRATDPFLYEVFQSSVASQPRPDARLDRTTSIIQNERDRSR